VRCEVPYTPLYDLFSDNGASARNYPVASRYFKEALILPLFSFMKEEEIDHVVRSLQLAMR
jgi:dTDP-4-amino-4,6-dideoxygalactose transaminase